VVPIQVQALRVRTLAHAAHGPVLAGPVGDRDPLVPIRVVDRRDQEHEGIEPPVVVAGGHGPKQRLGRFLPLHLPAVDVGEHENARAARGPHLGRAAGRQPAPDDHERQGTALKAVAERGPMQVG
jgi:hypothetical protein